MTKMRWDKLRKTGRPDHLDRDRNGATKLQLKLLKKLGYEPPKGLTKYSASLILDNLIKKK